MPTLKELHNIAQFRWNIKWYARQCDWHADAVERSVHVVDVIRKAAKVFEPERFKLLKPCIQVDTWQLVRQVAPLRAKRCDIRAIIGGLLGGC